MYYAFKLLCYLHGIQSCYVINGAESVMGGVKRTKQDSKSFYPRKRGNSGKNGRTDSNQFGGDNETCTYEELMETAAFLQERVSFKPLIGIICGTGLGCIADCLKETVELPYETIPHFPVSTVAGHAGKLTFGHFSDIPVVCMNGRFHHYEGYPLWKCVIPIRVMKLIGVKYVILTNAVGGLNPKYKVGDILMVKDHINIMGFVGNNPLQGVNDDRLGPRFLTMTNAYDKKLLEIGRNSAEQLSIADTTHEGVITCVAGPNFETVAEMKALRALGADAVGMSVVHEAVTARHCGLTVFAFSLITNMCIMDYDNNDETKHEEVMDVGKIRQDVLRDFVENIVAGIGNIEVNTSNGKISK